MSYHTAPAYPFQYEQSPASYQQYGSFFHEDSYCHSSHIDMAAPGSYTDYTTTSSDDHILPYPSVEHYPTSAYTHGASTYPFLYYQKQQQQQQQQQRVPRTRKVQETRKEGEYKRLFRTRARLAVIGIDESITRQYLIKQFGAWFAFLTHITVHDADIIEATDKKPRIAYITLYDCAEVEAKAWCSEQAYFFQHEWPLGWRVEAAYHQPAVLDTEKADRCLAKRLADAQTKEKKVVTPQEQLAKRKTRICRNFTNGSCPFGLKCNFAHGHDEIEYEKPAYSLEQNHAV